MRPAAGELLHFSEDPTITRFVPHVAATAEIATPYVWAVDGALAPGYWFPRACPRAMAWAIATTTDDDRERILGPGAPRVHAIEYGWLDALQTVRLFAYRVPAAPFRPTGEPRPHGFVCPDAVEPLGPPQPVGDLLALHRAAGIQLRVMDTLWEFWDAVVGSSLDFSGIRLRFAQPRSTP